MSSLVGLMGQKRSGKDTTANVLIVRYGFIRFAFADPMKEAMLQLDPVVKDGARLSNIVSMIGWEGAKTYPEVRRLLQHFGVAIRDIQPDFWVKATMTPALMRLHSGSPVVITDVRFPNEAEAISEAGGKLVRVDRPGLPDDDQHLSEHAWRAITPDLVIENDSTLEALETRITDIAASL